MIHQAVAPLLEKGKPLVAWGPPQLMDLFEGSNAVTATVPDGAKPGAFEMAGLLRRHRAGGLINLPRSTRGLLAGALARTPIRVGWSESGGRFLATHSVPFKGREDHQIERYKDAVGLAFPNLDYGNARPFVPREEAMAEAFRLRQGLGLEGAYVGIGLSSAAAVKRLGTHIWLEVMAWLRAEGIPHVLLGGNAAEDMAQAEAIRAVFPDTPDLCGKTSLAVSSALVSQAAVLVGNDSGLSHLAAASHTSLIVVFGPTRPSLTAPRGPRVQILQHEPLDCLGCLRLGCPVPGHPCMESIDPALLIKALEAFLPKAANT
ncbi:glycosyltransferase family 9 protein [Geothrix limicola]|nr:glycosyltransferase family 9 protein [Geothrix limicola]